MSTNIDNKNPNNAAPSKQPRLEGSVYDYRDIDSFKELDAEVLASCKEKVKKAYGEYTTREVIDSFNNLDFWLGDLLDLLYDIVKWDYNKDRVETLEEKYEFVMADYKKYAKKSFLKKLEKENSHGLFLAPWILERFEVYIEAVYNVNDDLLDGQFLGIFPDMHDDNFDMYFKVFFIDKVLEIYPLLDVSLANLGAVRMFPYFQVAAANKLEYTLVECTVDELIEMTEKVKYLLLKT